MHWTTRLAAAVAASTLVLVSCSSEQSEEAASSSAPTTDAAADFARPVDIGGRNIYLTCNGSNQGGDPTIILVSGYHDSSDVWTQADVLSTIAPAKGPAVFPALAESHRVCAYDRPGTVRYVDDGPLTDRSTPVQQPRTAADLVAELHDTLAAAQVQPPYVLVGHSLGGLIVLLYGKTHPDQVRGIVFVDAFSPTVPEMFGAQWPIYRDQLLNPPLDQAPMPSMRSPQSERVDLDASVAQVQSALALPQMPLAVLTKTESFAGLTRVSGLSADDLNKRYEHAQDTLVGLAPATAHIFATGSDHYIQFSQPDLVLHTTDLVVGRAAG